MVAQTTISNEAGIGFDANGRASGLTVKCILRVTVTLTDSGNLLAEYESDYRVSFKPIQTRGVVPGVNIPGEVLAPYITMANWLAVRRADGSLASGGIGNLRLQMPEVQMELLPRDTSGAAAAALAPPQ